MLSVFERLFRIDAGNWQAETRPHAQAASAGTAAAIRNAVRCGYRDPVQGRSYRPLIDLPGGMQELRS